MNRIVIALIFVALSVSLALSATYVTSRVDNSTRFRPGPSHHNFVS